MRTSRISQDTTRIFNALSPNARVKRSTRSTGKGLATFALGYDGTVEVKREEQDVDVESTPSEISDIEDTGTPARSRKRKRDTLTPPKAGSTIIKTEHTTTWSSPRRQRKVKREDQEHSDEYEEKAEQDDEKLSTSPRKALPKHPAKRSTSPGGTTRYTPPSNWETIYKLIHAHRTANPVAPVDTMGCEDLFWQSSPPRQQRYHTLTALMLSSQTKDTVTAAAMQRLHTELIPNPPLDPTTQKPIQSSLTIENILTCDPTHLDNLIGKVGFHNTKTRHIKLAATILAQQYDHDIPSTIEGLISLPGVGPKMAYLAMSAAWHEDLGIGVDVHVHRITNMWGWHSTKNPEGTREWLEGWLPKEKWHEINKVLVGLGQTICLPVGRRCGECPLAGKGLCKGEVRGWVNKEAKKKRVKKEDKDKNAKVEVEVDVEKATIKAEDGEELLREEKVEVKREDVLDG